MGKKSLGEGFGERDKRSGNLPLSYPINSIIIIGNPAESGKSF
jgi:hypothetical protein